MARYPVYDSVEVANYLIEQAKPDGLDPLQVMKLSYICHGFLLGYRNRPLLEDDIEAWKLGPVVRRIYDKLPGGDVVIRQPFDKWIAEFIDEKKLIDKVFRRFSKYSGLELSSLTHKEGTPWDLTWRTYGRNAVIPQDLIKKHFQEVIAIGRIDPAKGL